jgi:hypothetical protein
MESANPPHTSYTINDPIPSNIFIPIGVQCTSAQFLRLHNIRSCGLPFDWIYSHPQFIYNVLQAIFVSHLESTSIALSVFFNHQFQENGELATPDIRDNLTLVKAHASDHFATDPTSGNLVYNPVQRILFPHDNLLSSAESRRLAIQKYARRITRLKHAILKCPNIHFVYTSQPAFSTSKPDVTGNISVDGVSLTQNVHLHLNNIISLIQSIRNSSIYITHSASHSEKITFFRTTANDLPPEDSNTPLLPLIRVFELASVPQWHGLIYQMNDRIHEFLA